MSKPTVLLADDHRIVLEGLRTLLEPEFELVGTVPDGRALLKAAKKLDPDVIVLDISMPALNGMEAARKLRDSGMRARIVFLTMHPDAAYATRALDAGASGYVLKHSASSELVTAIREALRGRTYVTPIIAGELVHAYKESAPQRQDADSNLTPRQREVLQLLAEGRSAKDIADALCISPRTVEFHKYRMMEELSIRTTAELVRFAVKHGIVDE